MIEFLTLWQILLALIIDTFSVSNLVSQKMVQHAPSYIEICLRIGETCEKGQFLYETDFSPVSKTLRWGTNRIAMLSFDIIKKPVYIYVKAAILRIKNYPSLMALFKYTFNSYIYNVVQISPSLMSITLIKSVNICNIRVTFYRICSFSLVSLSVTTVTGLQRLTFEA